MTCALILSGGEVCGQPPDALWLHVNPDDSRAIDHTFYDGKPHVYDPFHGLCGTCGDRPKDDRRHTVPFHKDGRGRTTERCERAVTTRDCPRGHRWLPT